MSLIPSGTVIDKRAPKDWTHLILKSQPKVKEGDVEALSRNLRELSGMFFTAMLARVKENKVGKAKKYTLDTIAIGLGTRIGKEDTIITSDTQAKLGANLSFLARTALRRAEERLQNVKMVVRSDSMALFDAPVIMLRGGKHRPVVLRYAVLVDPKTGQLETVLWAIDQDSSLAYKGTFGDAEWLPPNKIEDRILHVDAKEFSFGLVTENALAMVKLYRGKKQLRFTKDDRVAGRARLTASEATVLEKRLWALLRASEKK
jgi:hypothetical protein